MEADVGHGLGASLTVSGDSSFASKARNPPVGREAFSPLPPQSAAAHRNCAGTRAQVSAPPPGARCPCAGDGGARSLKVSPASRPGVALTRKGSTLVSPQPQNRPRSWAPESPERHQAGSTWISTTTVQTAHQASFPPGPPLQMGWQAGRPGPQAHRRRSSGTFGHWRVWAPTPNPTLSPGAKWPQGLQASIGNRGPGSSG